jgi:hypothetical protein
MTSGRSSGPLRSGPDDPQFRGDHRLTIQVAKVPAAEVVRLLLAASLAGSLIQRAR